METKKLMVFCGYTLQLHYFVVLLYGFLINNFFSETKQKINLNFPSNQTKGIIINKEIKYFINI